MTESDLNGAGRKWKEYALAHGMKPCVLCGEPVGGRCPSCDRFICFGSACTVPVRLVIGEHAGSIAWRCRPCAAEIVLSGEGELTEMREKEAVKP